MLLLRRTVSVALLATAALAAATPVRLIFDTDYMTDCDDPGALGMLHALADNGECAILGTFSSGLNDWAAPAIDAVNTYYGRGDIPVANVKGAGVNMSSSYAQYLAQNFPQDTVSGTATPDALAAYRELLAGQADRSVVIVTVGYATNLRNLLASPPDDYSPLSGSNLVAAKVAKWVNMGGNFEARAGIDTTNVNWTRDKESAVTAIRTWPTEIVFNGREIGHSMRAGVRLALTPATNPVRVAYERYFGGTAKDRHCADPSATLYAVRGLVHGSDRYWELQAGRIAINDDASFTWTPGAMGARGEARMIDAITDPTLGLMAPTEVDEIIEDLMVQLPLGSVLTLPGTPTGGTASVDGAVPGKVVLTWTSCAVAHPASWVAGYRVTRNGTPLGKALGPQFVDVVPASGTYAYAVAAFTASGVVGQSLDIAAHVTLPEEPPPPPPPSAGNPMPYAVDADTLALYHFDEAAGTVSNVAGSAALNLTDTGGPTGRGGGGGGYGAGASAGFGAAFDVPKSGDGQYHASTSGSGGGLQTASAVFQSSLQGPDGAFTYEALVVLHDAAREQEILSHDGSSARSFLFRIVDGTLSLYNGSASFTASLPTSGDHAVVAGEWFHAAVAYNGAASTASNLLFYWTRLDAGGASANRIGTATLPADLSTAANVNKLGVGTSTRSPFRFEPARVDEVRISAVARTAEALIARVPVFRGTAVIVF